MQCKSEFLSNFHLIFDVVIMGVFNVLVYIFAQPGPHPGLRAAAEMQKQQSQGTGRGMMGIVLPMYAVGICVYLVYTLFKVRLKIYLKYILVTHFSLLRIDQVKILSAVKFNHL